AATRKRELQTALDSARVAKEQAERAHKLKSDFLSMVSHELRTPLSTLVFQFEYLERSPGEPLPPRYVKALPRMVAAARRLSEMVTSLLEYARLQSQKLPLERAPVDLGALAQALVEELVPHATEKGLTLRLAGGSRGPVVIDTDARLLRIVLSHLLTNAIKFTDAGEVVLGIEKTEDRARVSVGDTG